eukprot:scaffold299609_cov63-Attheya_sp.AAC.1
MAGNGANRRMVVRYVNPHAGAIALLIDEQSQSGRPTAHPPKLGYAQRAHRYTMEGKQESSMMGMVVLAESLNIKDTSVMLSTQQYAKWQLWYVATWVPLVQIETASITQG